PTSTLFPYTTLFRSVVVSGAALDDDVNDDDIHLHRIVGEQLHRLFTKAGTRPATELAWSTFEHACKPVIGEYRKQPVHFPGVIRSEEHTSELQSRFD